MDRQEELRRIMAETKAKRKRKATVPSPQQQGSSVLVKRRKETWKRDVVKKIPVKVNDNNVDTVSTNDELNDFLSDMNTLIEKQEKKKQEEAVDDPNEYEAIEDTFRAKYANTMLRVVSKATGSGINGREQNNKDEQNESSSLSTIGALLKKKREKRRKASQKIFKAFSGDEDTFDTFDWRQRNL